VEVMGRVLHQDREDYCPTCRIVETGSSWDE
jgi:hypothetical protein